MPKLCDRSYFELTTETKKLYAGIDGHKTEKVTRIRATRDIPEHGVKAGDVGGFVSSKQNLQYNGWVADDAVVSDTAIVTAGLVSGNAHVLGGSSLYGSSAKVTDNAVLNLNSHIQDNVVISGNAQIHNTVLRGLLGSESTSVRVADLVFIKNSDIVANIEFTGDGQYHNVNIRHNSATYKVSNTAQVFNLLNYTHLKDVNGTIRLFNGMISFDEFLNSKTGYVQHVNNFSDVEKQFFIETVEKYFTLFNI